MEDSGVAGANNDIKQKVDQFKIITEEIKFDPVKAGGGSTFVNNSQEVPKPY